MGRRTKLDRYRAIREQLASLVVKSRDPTARRATTVALLFAKLRDVSWAGFYVLRRDRLVVDVYQGPVACLELAAHQGVCWAAIDRGEAVIVPDVEAFPGHVACDARTRSEIVVPWTSADGAARGVLDLDSRRLDRFDDEDRTGLEGILELLEFRLDASK